MSCTIKEFWLLTLSFKSALHIGSGSSGAFMGAAEIIRNGAGKYMIPGTSLAGVFLSTLRNCVEAPQESSRHWQELTGTIHKGDESCASNLLFRSAEIEPRYLQVRDRVSINRSTKTAKEGAKFSAWEVIPHDLQILLEFDNMSKATVLTDDECQLYKTWIEAVLYYWQQDGFFLGADTGIGSGYVKLDKIQHCRLDKNNFQTYLDSSYAELPTANMGWQDISIAEPSIVTNSAFLKKYRIKLKADYQNPLLIKGGISYLSEVNPDTDAPFITRNGKPFIPGSSIRGAISSFMDKYELTDWQRLLGQEAVTEGETTHGGYIIFTDLKLTNNDAKLVQLERHAEDQFSRAIFGSGKFDEERIFNAEFQGDIYVLQGMPISRESLNKLMNFLLTGAKMGAISIGSGACYPQISLEEVK